MRRLDPVSRESADESTVQLLDAVEKKLGLLPNIFATMAQSNAVANAYLGFSSALASGELSVKVREQIALTVGQQNDCGYCVAAHTVIGAGAGLGEDEVIAARQGKSADAKSAGILNFVTKLVENRGNVSDQDVEALKQLGLSQGEIAEVVANVALNMFTNYFNHVAGTEVDFPEPAALPAVVG